MPISGVNKNGNSATRSVFFRRGTVESPASVWQPFYSRVAYRNFDVNYIRLERGVKPEHEHESLQVSVALNRQPMIAAERKSFGIVSRQPFLFGDICVIPSWQRHAVNWDRQTEWVSFHLAPRYVQRAARDLGVKKSSIEFVSAFCRRDKQIFWLGNALGATLCCGDDDASNLYVESLADTLVEHLLNFYAADKTNIRAASGGLAPGKLRLVAEFVDAHLDRNLMIEELAQAAGLSRFHFARQFKQSTGFAPHQYIMQQRIERAKQLLNTTDLPLVEIALSIGFISQSHFAAAFRRATGATPTAYRRRL